MSLRFSVDGRYVAADKSNSHVWVLDLVEMDRRLSELHSAGKANGSRDTEELRFCALGPS